MKYKETNMKNERNTYKEHLQYNEKEQNLKNIAFDLPKFFNPYQNIMGPCYACQPHQNFNPCHVKSGLK